MNRRRLLQSAAWAMAMPLLSACGFQFSGATRLPPQLALVYIDASDPFTPLYRSLRRSLEEHRNTVVDERERATAVVHVLTDETGERVLSVSGRNIPREFEVYYLVDFALTLNRTERIDFQRLTAIRSYSWDETQVLGKAEEGRRMQQALADDLVARMLRQFSTIA